MPTLVETLNEILSIAGNSRFTDEETVSQAMKWAVDESPKKRERSINMGHTWIDHARGKTHDQETFHRLGALRGELDAFRG